MHITGTIEKDNPRRVGLRDNICEVAKTQEQVEQRMLVRVVVRDIESLLISWSRICRMNEYL